MPAYAMPASIAPVPLRVLPSLLDAVSARARVSQTYVIALSFSGHLALRCALADSRLRGVVIAGAPIRHFFTDADWRRRLPRITRDTLAHLTGAKEDAFADHVDAWALTDEHLSQLSIPIHAVISGRDEIIPSAETTVLRRAVSELTLLTHDDVRGSPRHALETRLWTVLAIMRMRGIRNLRTAALSSAIAALRARCRVLRR